MNRFYESVSQSVGPIVTGAMVSHRGSDLSAPHGEQERALVCKGDVFRASRVTEHQNVDGQAVGDRQRVIAGLDHSDGGGDAVSQQSPVYSFHEPEMDGKNAVASVVSNDSRVSFGSGSHQAVAVSPAQYYLSQHLLGGDGSSSSGSPKEPVGIPSTEVTSQQSIDPVFTTGEEQTKPRSCYRRAVRWTSQEGGFSVFSSYRAYLKLRGFTPKLHYGQTESFDYLPSVLIEGAVGSKRLSAIGRISYAGSSIENGYLTPGYIKYWLWPMFCAVAFVIDSVGSACTPYVNRGLGWEFGFASNHDALHGALLSHLGSDLIRDGLSYWAGWAALIVSVMGTALWQHQTAKPGVLDNDRLFRLLWCENLHAEMIASFQTDLVEGVEGPGFVRGMVKLAHLVDRYGPVHERSLLAMTELCRLAESVGWRESLSGRGMRNVLANWHLWTLGYTEKKRFNAFMPFL